MTQGEVSMKSWLAIAVIGAIGITGTITASAQEEASGVVALRQGVMKTLGLQTQIVKGVVTGETDQMATAAAAADTIQNYAYTLPALFPEGSISGMGPTDALPAIWEKPDEFKQAAERLADLAAALKAEVEAGDPKKSLAAFARLGKEGCGGCHADFRKKKS